MSAKEFDRAMETWERAEAAGYLKARALNILWAQSLP